MCTITSSSLPTNCTAPKPYHSFNMTSPFMWKSLESYIKLCLKSIPFDIDCKSQRAFVAKRGWISRWLFFVTSLGVQFLVELWFLFRLIFDRSSFHSVQTLEILICGLYITLFTLYFITCWTIVTDTSETLQYVNGLVQAEKRFRGNMQTFNLN